ncbi:MAG: glyoxalase [Thiotrichales bacterium]|nr:glyoxalase [Thiotrichales bacterium]|tara:strand:- start:2618 stop:2995 length:378 start_codon:yes stop_codon:yes gene_type:complete
MKLDHYTIHTTDLARARRFYEEVLGLSDGYRPPFEGPPGAWLYGPEQRPIVHLYEGRGEDEHGNGPLDHIAFVIDQVDPYVERLRRHHIHYDTADVPELGGKQVFFRDPDGIQIELSYEPAATSP